MTPMPLLDDCEERSLHPQAVITARERIAATPPVDEIAAIFAILSDPTRLRLLAALTSGELCVCDLALATGINRTTVSHQLRILRENRIVRRRREGKNIYYTLDDHHVASLLSMSAAHVAETAPGASKGEVEDGRLSA